MSLRAWSCGHSETTAEDGEGYAVCLNCGSTVTIRLTPAILERQLANLRIELGIGRSYPIIEGKT